MKTLTVSLADLEGQPHGSHHAATNVTVSARYTGPVALTDGTLIPAGIKSKQLPATGSVSFEVYASDDTAVATASQGFAVVVTAEGKGLRGERAWRVARTVKVLESHTSPVALGSLEPAEGLPRGWVSVAEVVGDFDSRLDALESSSPGNGIEYVSGTVTPDESVAVHEYFTTGAATIDGVDYEAEQAVVLFRVLDLWSHVPVNVPRPPSVELVGSYYDTSMTPSGSWSFTGTGSTTEPGLLVACVFTHRSRANVTVGGSVLPRVVDVAGWTNPTPSMHALPVGQGHPLDDVQISLADTSLVPWVAIDLLLITRVDPVPYLVVEPDESSTNGAYALDAPRGSIVISCHVDRGPTYSVRPTVWLDPMNELTNQYVPGNYPVGSTRETWHIRPSSGWGRHAGNGAFRLSEATSQLFATAVFKAAVR